VGAWCRARGATEERIVAVQDRLALALLTESSGGYVFANDGGAYAAGKRPDLPDATRQRVYDVLRVSLNLPHDRVGRDGRSTGPLQQISTEAVAALTPNGINWGWADMATTMQPEGSAVAFVRRLVVTGDKLYRTPQGLTVDCGDPIVADVLRTQQPAVGASLPPNYRAEQVALAKRIARGGPRFFTDGG
jgi:hypothetical protein